MSNIGGINNIRSNFNVSSIPKEIPNFYKECLKSWASFVSSDPTGINEILLQPIWNNNKICQNGKSFFIKELFTSGIYSMQDGIIKTIIDLKCTNPKLNCIAFYFIHALYGHKTIFFYYLNSLCTCVETKQKCYHFINLKSISIKYKK